MDFTVIVTTFGDRKWADLAQERAVPSGEREAPVAWFHVDGDVALGRARNHAVDFHDVQGWLCFLDADDELEEGFGDAMRRRIGHPSMSTTNLLAPSLRMGEHGPIIPLAQRNIMKTNPCPIGTLIHRDTFDRVGRFWDERAWEDWSLFRRAHIAGSKIVFVHDAVYVNHSTDGRNSTVVDPHRLHREIVQSHRKWARR